MPTQERHVNIWKASRTDGNSVGHAPVSLWSKILGFLNALRTIARPSLVVLPLVVPVNSRSFLSPEASCATHRTCPCKYVSNIKHRVLTSSGFRPLAFDWDNSLPAPYQSAIYPLSQ
ncbi:hypothetical protein BC938DRAFT_477487, partial [Jimgerdemannia flammicorona]